MLIKSSINILVVDGCIKWSNKGVHISVSNSHFWASIDNLAVDDLPAYMFNNN